MSLSGMGGATPFLSPLNSTFVSSCSWSSITSLGGRLFPHYPFLFIKIWPLNNPILYPSYDCLSSGDTNDFCIFMVKEELGPLSPSPSSAWCSIQWVTSALFLIRVFRSFRCSAPLSWPVLAVSPQYWQVKPCYLHVSQEIQYTTPCLPHFPGVDLHGRQLLNFGGKEHALVSSSSNFKSP